MFHYQLICSARETLTNMRIVCHCASVVRILLLSKRYRVARLRTSTRRSFLNCFGFLTSDYTTFGKGRESVTLFQVTTLLIDSYYQL